MRLKRPDLVRLGPDERSGHGRTEWRPRRPRADAGHRAPRTSGNASPPDALVSDFCCLGCPVCGAVTAAPAKESTGVQAYKVTCSNSPEGSSACSIPTSSPKPQVSRSISLLGLTSARAGGGPAAYGTRQRPGEGLKALCCPRVYHSMIC